LEPKELAADGGDFDGPGGGMRGAGLIGDETRVGNVFGDGEGGGAGTVGVGLDQLATAGVGERGGEEDDGGAEGGQPFEDALEERGHLGVIGVDLIDDDGLAGQAEQADEDVAGLHAT